ncbi:lycopene biosynthesis protein [Salmonella enterica subsp. enterica]|nr:lycopene biosynthesis protein [Salmonella enterica subsp. enterica serovar Braenderup]EDL6138957.1 lycopene biosynthesis protein [Salmonella enterica subsp. enterica serovar Typhimurium]PSG06543.1 lycopene biosynthesis protein [Escherichia coli]
MFLCFKFLSIKNNKGCPPESEQAGSRCPNDHCILAICPYGRK